MAKEKFLLVSLNESKSKQLAQAISNDSCRKILDYLADKESSESELSTKLNIPISTVHYNLQQLIKGGLVIAEEYHYSKKGKEIKVERDQSWKMATALGFLGSGYAHLPALDRTAL